MANSGEEESQHSFTHDVFLSFRGPDTRHTIIGYLYEQLTGKGINAFIDDKKLEFGDVISRALLENIKDSKAFIVVLSENYASSTWCLEELVNILDCATEGNQRFVFPIFYHVDPSTVRYQKGKYAEAMVRHESRYGKDRVQPWRSALEKVCELSGGHICTTGYEVNHVQDIVNKVCDKVGSKLLHTKGQVGLEQRVEDAKLLLEMKPDDHSVLMLGIHGLGGIGKTELAKALYNNIVHKFEAASFLENVREKSSKVNGPEVLQNTLLSKMFQRSETGFGSTSQGIPEIKRKLRKKKILLVLDDVDDREQLDYLAGGCDWFGPGSRIIITTRDEDLIGDKKIYKMKELDEQHSLELFCQNAFGKSHPETGFEEMSSRAVGYAKGFPLALKVIGSDLASKKELEYWESALKEYESQPHEKIQDVLQRSYDKLPDNAKHVFLDIACFFKGHTEKYVKMILEKFHAASNITVLVRKSLLTIGEDGCLNMHDLIQDMGREVVRNEAPQNPGQRSRLWSHDDVIEVLTQDWGSDAIQGIMLDPPRRTEVEWSGTAFEKMKRLRILIIRNTSFSSEPGYLPNYLRLLDWEDCPSKSFPPIFHPKDIIVFILCKSYLTLEKPFKTYSCLTIMRFSNNQSITEMPSVSGVPNLEEVALDYCGNLTKVHESVGRLKNLIFLRAQGCAKLIDFPQSVYLPSLEFLNIGDCISLKYFPNIMNKMNKELRIIMANTAIEELPCSICNLTGLLYIDMSNSMKLRYVPSSLFMLPNLNAVVSVGCPNLGGSFRMPSSQSNAAVNARSTLKVMNFKNCGLSDEDLHGILYSGPDLENLIASKNKFASLPKCVKECVHLTSLDVSDCRELERIPECTSLRILDVSGCVNLKEISKLPSTIQKVDASQCCSLTTETLDMLWDQVKKERHLEVRMHQTNQKIPEWFDWKGDGGFPYFWVRGKFPIVVLALFFSNEKGAFRSRSSVPPKSHIVELDLVINGQCVHRKDNYKFKILEENVLVCDLRVLVGEEDWLGLDAFLVHDWNVVQVSCKSTFMRMPLSHWGVFVYKHETNNMKDVQFLCPGIEYSCPNMTVPPSDLIQAIMKIASNLEAEDGAQGDVLAFFQSPDILRNCLEGQVRANTLFGKAIELFDLPFAGPGELVGGLLNLFHELQIAAPGIFHNSPIIERELNLIETMNETLKHSDQNAVLEGKSIFWSHLSPDVILKENIDREVLQITNFGNENLQHLMQQTLEIVKEGTRGLLEKVNRNLGAGSVSSIINAIADSDEAKDMMLKFTSMDGDCKESQLEPMMNDLFKKKDGNGEAPQESIIALLNALYINNKDVKDEPPREEHVTALDAQEMSLTPNPIGNMIEIAIKAMSAGMKDVKDEAPREEHVTALDAQEMSFDPLNMRAIPMSRMKGVKHETPGEEHATSLDAQEMSLTPNPFGSMIENMMKAMSGMKDVKDEAPREEHATDLDAQEMSSPPDPLNMMAILMKVMSGMNVNDEAPRENVSDLDALD